MFDDINESNNNNNGGGGAPKWMTTFADLNSLLLCFFVLLFSFSTVDVDKYRGMLASMQQAFGMAQVSKAVMNNTPGSITSVTPDGSMIALRNQIASQYGRSNLIKDSNTPAKISDQEAKKDREEKINDIMTKLDEIIRSLGLEDEVGIKSNEMGILLDIKGEILFFTGKASISNKGNNLLKKIAPIIKQYPSNKIMVEGHTDNIPISTKYFPSNWELSSARAASVVRIFIEEYRVPSDSFTAVGYADTKPLVPNTTPQNRAINRRVNFIFMVP